MCQRKSHTTKFDGTTTAEVRTSCGSVQSTSQANFRTTETALAAANTIAVGQFGWQGCQDGGLVRHRFKSQIIGGGFVVSGLTNGKGIRFAVDSRILW